MSLKLTRFLSLSHKRLGVWSEFNSRAPALKILDSSARDGVFSKISKNGPLLIANEDQRKEYHSPEAIDDVFASAYELLEENSAKKYRFLAENEGKLTPLQVEQTLVAAEEHNPEVLYNVNFSEGALDRSLPVYRKFLREKWEAHDLMVTMQRLEQHHVIPDTLPTVEPRADVKVKFGHNVEPEFGSWVVPGTKLPARAVARPPTIEVQEFETADAASGLYTVLLVNPDVPDLQANSFKTSLNYGLYNVPLTFSDNTISPAKLLSSPEQIFQQYVPLVPEKNSPTQRACLWVFRQPEQLQELDFKTHDFDIRKFVDEYGLHAVGAHMWRQEFDRSVTGVRKEYGLQQGRVYDPIRGDEPLV